jgi:hypothetical protein
MINRLTDKIERLTEWLYYNTVNIVLHNAAGVSWLMHSAGLRAQGDLVLLYH